MKDFYLGPNHFTETPTNIICLDTEAWTHNEDHIQRLRLVCATFMQYDDRRKSWDETKQHFDNVEDFQNWLEKIFKRFDKKGARVWIISHNMAYDFPILEMDNYLSNHGWKHPTLFVPSTPFLYYTSRGETKGKKLTLRIISTTNWYNWPLKKLAPIFSKEKIILSDPDFDKITDTELIQYCERDAEIVVDIVKGHMKFIEDNDLGTFQPTLAGQAFSAFRHQFMDVPLLVHHTPKLVDMELSAYKGGRTEALQIGNASDVYILDVNSMYPSVMRSSEEKLRWYPTKPKCNAPLFIGDNILPECFQEDFIIAECEIIMKEPCIGVHRKEDHKLVFPKGNIKTVLTSPELLYIENHPDVGSINNYLRIIPYEQSCKVFNRYVDFFYEMKKNSENPVTTQEAKLFLNSLYGKFGQRSHAPVEELGTDESDMSVMRAMDDLNLSVMYEKDRTYIRSGQRIMVKSKANKGTIAYNSMPRIAAAVTAYARLSLWDIIKIAKLKNVFYCDTDSIMTNQEGLSRCIKAGLCDESRLGALKWEGPYDIEFLSPKHYGINKYHWKSKGIRKNAKQITSNSWEQDQFQTGMSRYRNGIMDGVKVSSIIKTCKDINDKGTVTKSGRVEPLVFHDF